MAAAWVKAYAQTKQHSTIEVNDVGHNGDRQTITNSYTNRIHREIEMKNKKEK